MKRKNLLYIPLLLLFAFAGSVLAIHYGKIVGRLNLDPDPYIIPFHYFNGAATNVTEKAREAGLKPADKIKAINGKPINSSEEFRAFAGQIRSPEPLIVSIERTDDAGAVINEEISITPTAFTISAGYYGAVLINFLFVYFLPTFCILLGFWVVFMRPHDYLAWLLLFLLCGLASFSMEGYPADSLVGLFRRTFFNAFAPSMLLFGIYFPERWSVDRKIPWAKWILLVPLGFQVLVAVLLQAKAMLGINVVDYLAAPASFYSRYFGSVVNIVSIGLFFAILTHKSFTLKNPDSRRRLKLMSFGTTLAMTPFFLIFLYSITTGAKGSFFDMVPGWIVIIALILMNLFPLTMAYVIVVHRAMDVRVVVRQGLQYALATSGVKVLQFILLGVVILGVIWIFRSSTGFSAAQQIGFVAAGFALIPLIDYGARNLRVWIDRKFFREAYDAEQILTELSEQVRTMVEMKPLLETVSNRISESLHVPQIALLLKNGSAFHPAYALGFEAPPAVQLSEDDKTVEKLKRNEPLTVYQDDAESWTNEEIDEAEREKLQKLNSQLLLPIGAKNELAGLISLSPKLSEEPFTPNDLRLLKSVAAQTGLALENSRLTEAIAREAALKERLNRELEIAREVQQRLFPQELPSVEGLDYYGACRPALGVGGDYYDFLELPEGKFGIAIGDISGKGIGASLMMASLQASLRGQTIHFKEELAEMMKHINTLLYEASTSNRYATFFYAQYDPKTGKLIYVNAGHNPPVLLRPKTDDKTDFEMILLEDGGPVVGMLPSMFVSYEQGEIELRPGDLVVGSTDGITEAMNPQEEEWGEEQMIEELKKVYDRSSEEILNHIVEKADEFAAGAKQHDDMTMIVIKAV
jgi:sigma-B regulation protein RsbU (phosphoserine phosphatase)